MRHQPIVRRVVLVVLDGLRPDAIDAFGLRSWQRLASEGASSLCGTTVGPSVTAAAMASLFTGVEPAVHGLKSDRFHLPKSTAPLDLLPRVLAAAGEPTSAFIRRLPLLFRGLGRRVASYLGVEAASFCGRTATEILFAASEPLANQERGLILLHWPDCDQAGHAHGWMSPAYARAAQRLDLALGLLAACAEVGRDPGTLLIALADHGGGGVDHHDHESDHPLDRTIPVLLTGCAVEGDEIDAPSLLDIPPTVLWALGIPQPSGWAGRPLYEAFEARARAVGQA